ncbi:MAG: RidA family protein [Candidatus Neomarinimicrobiota bacterium]
MNSKPKSQFKPVLLLQLLLVLGCGWPMLEREIIATDKAPAAIGPYSQAVRAGRTLYLAGQIGLDPSTGQLVSGGIENETHQVMANIQAVLEAAGYTLTDVVQVQAYLADLDEYGAFNAVYAGYFGDRPPARAVVQAVRLPRDVRVEVMATAVK